MDDDFYGAECEMDDQMLIVDSEDEDIIETEANNDLYELEFSAKEAEYTFGSEMDENEISLRRRPRRKSSNRVYPPERKPPIFDFFTVLTAFIVAVILAYYTISTY